MIATIYKMELDDLDVNTWVQIQMPQDALILTVQVQDNIPVIWYICHPSKPIENSELYLATTGAELDSGVLPDYYVGTYQLLRGTFVVHAFARKFILPHEIRGRYDEDLEPIN